MSNNVVCNNLTATGNSTIGSNAANSLLINSSVTFQNGVTYNTANITHNGNLITNQPIYANNGIVLTGNLTGNFSIPVLTLGNTASNNLIVGRDNTNYPTGNTTTISPSSGLEIYWNKIINSGGQTDFLNKAQGSTTGGFTFNTVTVSSPPVNLFTSSTSLFDVKTPVKISNTDTSTTTTSGALVVSGGVGITGNVNISGIGNIPTLNSTTGTIATLNSTTGTIATLNSTNGTITTLGSTTGTIATLNSTNGTITTLGSTTGTIATLNSTNGTITTLGSTTGTIATLNSTNGTITTLNSTTGTVTTLNGGRINATNNTPSTNPTNGTLIVTGGVGISGNTFIGGILSTGGYITTTYNTGTIYPPSTGSGFAAGWNFSSGLGEVDIWNNDTGGLPEAFRFIQRTGTSTNSVLFQMFNTGASRINIPISVVSTNTTSGSLVVAGGVGVGGNLNIGGDMTTSGTVYVSSGTIKTTNTTLYLHANNSASYTASLDSTSLSLNSGVGLNAVGSSLNLGAGGNLNAVNVFLNSTQFNSQYLFVNVGNNSVLMGRPSASKPTTVISGGWGQPMNGGTEIFWNTVSPGGGQTDFLNYAGAGGGGYTFSIVTGTLAPTNLMTVAPGLAVHNTNVSINKSTNAHALDVSGTTNSTALIVQNKNAVSNYNNIVTNNFNLTIPFANLHFVNTNPNGADLTVNLPTITTAQDGAQFFIKSYGNYQVVVNSATANINYNNTFLTSRTIPVHQSWLFVCVSSSYYVLSTT